MRLENKVAVVTGAGSGIGKACAERFAREGAAVLVSDIDGDSAVATLKAIEEAGGRAFVQTCDSRNSDQVNALAQRCASEFGRMDIWMNLPALSLPTLVADMTDEFWRKIQAVTLDGTFFGMRAALSVMIPQQSGSIINMASAVALGPQPTLGAYGAAKAAIVHLTKTAALENAAHGIRINAIAPGMVETPPMMAWAKHAPQGLERLIKMIPMRRMGQPDEIANVALFLASDEASLVTGSNYIADAGASATSN